MTPTAETQCVWWPDHEGFNIWQSQCGLLWGLANDAPPKENQMNYCPKCGKRLVEGDGRMKNTAKAIIDIGQLIRGWGSSIDHRTYRNICDELASLVESAEGDITDKEYVDWWNENISHHEED